MIASKGNTGKKNSAPRRGAGRFALWAAVVAAAVVAVVAVIATKERDEELQSEETRKGLIPEVDPSVPSVPSAVEEAKVEKPKPVPFWEQDNTNGFNSAMIKKWKFMRRPKPSFTNDMAKNMPKLACEIFDSRIENEIAVLMTLEPGKSMIGMPKYGEAYEREFLESCERPIVISENDDDYTKQLKQDMIQVKMDLRDRMRKGEKIGDIIKESRLEAQRLSQLRADILSTLRETIAEAESDDDVDLSYEAANKMLEEYGISPVKPLSISKYWLQRRLRDNQ